MAETHPHSGYNKMDQVNSLVGNWVEERALKAATGDHRFKAWVPPADPLEVPTSVYALRTNGPDAIPTNERVFIHTIIGEHKPYASHTHLIHADPANPTDCNFVGDPKPGLRTAALMKKLMDEASIETPAPEEKTDFTSTKMASYTNHDMSGLTLGRRVMKTQDGAPISLEGRDAVWVAEAGICTKDRLDRERMASLDTTPVTGPYLSDIPVTYYTEALQAGLYPGGGPEGSKTSQLWKGGLYTAPWKEEANRANPLAKNTDFSKPMGAYNKQVLNE